MKTIQEKYNAVVEGKFSKQQFLKDAKRELSQFLSPFNGFPDTVSILKSKGILHEVKKEEASLEYECPVSEYSVEDLRRGVDFELEKAGVNSAGTVNKEDRDKAEKIAIKNLEKDRMHYLNILAGESAKVDKHDKMVEPTDKNKVDTFNGMKKAELKEEYTKEKLLKRLGDADDAHIQTGNGREYVIYNPNSNNDDNAAMWHDTSVFALDKDGGEHEIDYKDIGLVMVQESNQEESIANFIIKYYTNPKTGKSLIDDEIIGDFFKTHPESRDQEPEDALDNFQEFLSVNYESPGDYMQETETISEREPGSKPEKGEKEFEELKEKVAKSVDDVIDPAEYGAIGAGYLSGFNKPHSLSADDLEILGRKVVDTLHKGDFNAAKAKFVAEAMSDGEMETIKNYTPGSIDERPHEYKLGDKFSKDFDYDGMLKAGLRLKISTPLEKMQKLYDSFEDVNYHRENGHLGNAIDYIQDGDKKGALDHLKMFRQAVRRTLGEIDEGADKVKRVVKDSNIQESRGAFDMCVSAIQDIAVDGDISEREAAMEMMIGIADKYDFDMAGLESQLFNGDDAINEGRRRKTQGGKVVTENDYETGGYVESMGPLFDKGVNMLIKAWEEWKMGPMTEPGMIEFAKKDVLNYLETQFMIENLEEAKGKDHDQDGDIDGDDYKAAKDKAIKKAMGKEEIVKENIKAIITKVLKEEIIAEAATNELAKFAETYGGFEGMKPAIIQLQDLVTDIEAYYDKTRTKIQKVYDTLGDIRNEEGLKVGGFLAPSIESAFNKDLRPVTKSGFTKGLDQPKVKMISQKELDSPDVGVPNLGEEEKETVYSRPTVNGTLQEKTNK